MFNEDGIKQMYEAIGELALAFGNVYDTIIKLAIPRPVVTGITALAISLTTLFFCMEMFSQLAQFRVERIEDAIRIGMKFVVAKVIIENTDGIAGGIKAIFMKASSKTFSEAISQLAFDMPADLFDNIEAGFFDINYLILGFWGVLYMIVFFVIFVTILINIMGIIFEITIHQAVAPVALSTLCNDTVRQTGISFIKSYAAVCLQIGVIGAILQAFALIYPKLTALDTVILTFLKSPLIGSYAVFYLPLIALVVLSKAIKTSSEITKRMFGV